MRVLVSSTLSHAPLAVVAVLAMGCSALAGPSPAAASALALLVAGLALRRGARAEALVCAALALRVLLPDPSWPALPAPRQALADPLLRLLPEPDAEVAVGSLLGGRALLPRALSDAFARTGTSHLLAVSGFNITLAAGALGFALRPLGPRAASFGTLFAAVTFAWLAGFGASVLRAAAMTTVATAGALLGRRAVALNALGAAVICLLLVSPRAVGDVGFLMSVAATAGLVLWARPLEERLRGPGWLRAQLGATLAASLASLPISSEVFGRVPLVSPLANLVVAPLVPPLMGSTGIAMAVAAVSPPAALPAELLAFACARALRAVVELAASLPLASLGLPHAGIAVVAAYAGGAALWRSHGVLVRLPLRAAAVAALSAALASAGAISVARTEPVARVLALDVGQGDSFLVEAGGARLLVDGGPDPKQALRALDAVLPPFDRRLDVVALTHAHADHATGLAAILESHSVGLALEPAGIETNPVSSAWHDAVARSGVRLRAVRRGDRVRASGLTIDVLAPYGDPADTLANLALRVRAGALTVVFLGDATERGQEDLLLHPTELATDVYIPPHHGAATQYADALAAAAGAHVAVLSVGAGNRYGHPAPQTLRALAGMRALRTDRDGTLEVSDDGHVLECRLRPSALSRLWDGWLPRPPPCA